MKRLFTFGCSFTQFHWPTWADIIGQEFDYFENWGKGGQGNLFIFNSLNECAVKNKIQAGDTVIIMWSDIYRNDTYKNNAWTMGAEYQFDKTAMDDRGYLIRDSAHVHAARTMLDHYGATYYFLSLVPMTLVPSEAKLGSDVTDYYQDSMSLIKPSIYEKVFDFNWNSRPLIPVNCHHIQRPRIDYHASPLEHLEYIDQVLPEITLSDTTRSWVSNVNSHVLQDPRGQDPFDLKNYRPWVFSLNKIWQVNDVVRL